MKIFAIGDLHLSGTTPKPMDIFGDNWKNHRDKIESNWHSRIGDADLVLLPGDISWAMTIEEAIPDLQWIESLPGKKVMIRGNHDFWWRSLAQVKQAVGPSLHLIQNNSVTFDGVAVAGTRLWQDGQLNFNRHIRWQSREELGLPPEKENSLDDEGILQRELNRLKLSLESVSSRARKIIVMLHFPPTDFSFRETRAVTLMQKYGVDACVFGHLHSLIPERLPRFPVQKWGIRLYLASSDVIDFNPVEIKI